ncbi:MAG: 2'-5' RNA ligase family protein [Candidatus Omnitrophota bacterium]|jgi:2'-5' RNA ligase
MKLKYEANHNGAMLAVTVPPDVAAKVALPGGESPDGLHITVFYFYDAADIPAEHRRQIIGLSSDLGRLFNPFYIRLTGTEVFEENEERPLVALVECSELLQYRKALADAFDNAGIQYSKDYEYKPHLTLKYLQDEPRPTLEMNQGFSIDHLDAWFASERLPVHLGARHAAHKKGFVRMVNRRLHFAARPRAGQKQRPAVGSWEEATNRQQKKLVEAFDRWSAEVKRGLRAKFNSGNTTGQLSEYLDGEMPNLERRLSDIQAAGINAAVRISAKSRAELPAIQKIRSRQVADNLALIHDNLIPAIHGKLTLALAIGAVASGPALNEYFTSTRSSVAQYSGGYWVAIFEVQKGLGGIREDERRAQGLDVEPVRWVLDPMAEHCSHNGDFFGCPELAGDYPGGWSTLKTVPAGMVTCRGNCRCHLEVFREGKWKRGVYDD